MTLVEYLWTHLGTIVWLHSDPTNKWGLSTAHWRDGDCMHIYSCIYYLHVINSPVHTRVAGSGFHLPSAVHIALILSVGTNPGLHLKNISAPSVVFTNASMEPFPGTLGSLQLTVGRNCDTQGATWPPLSAGLVKFTYGWNGLHHSTAAPIAISSHNSDSVQYIIRQSDCNICKDCHCSTSTTLSLPYCWTM